MSQNRLPTPPNTGVPTRFDRTFISRHSKMKNSTAQNELRAFLSKWDRGSVRSRAKLLQEFLSTNSTRSSVELEQKFHNGSSLLLSRVSSSLRMVHTMTGAYTPKYISLHLRVAGLFVSAQSSPHEQFLYEIVSSGIVVVALEVLLLDEPFANIDLVHLESLNFISKLIRQGRVFKETICDFHALKSISECLKLTNSVEVQAASRSLLLDLSSGNPKYAKKVRDLLLVLLHNDDNQRAQEVAAQVLVHLFESNSSHFVQWSNDLNWVKHLIPVLLSLFKTGSAKLIPIANKLVRICASRRSICENLGVAQSHMICSRSVELREALSTRLRTSRSTIKMQVAQSRIATSLLELMSAAEHLDHYVSTVRVILATEFLHSVSILCCFSPFLFEVKASAQLLYRVKQMMSEAEVCRLIPRPIGRQLLKSNSAIEVMRCLDLGDERCLPLNPELHADEELLGDVCEQNIFDLSKVQESLLQLNQLKVERETLSTLDHLESLERIENSLGAPNIDLDFITSLCEPLSKRVLDIVSQEDQSFSLFDPLEIRSSCVRKEMDR